MAKKDLDIEIKEYLDNNWDQIVEDIKSLINIPSSINDGEFNNEFPNGTGACQAMEQALEICKRMGFKTKNHKNVIGIADYQGQSNTQIGFIGHCDVVAPGPGWHFDPYELNIVNGYMIGRGVLDDKGPSIILLHAINFWIQKQKELPYSIRFLFGTDEETFSTDIKTYKKDFPQPKLLITPDADFPVPYGEKGLMRFNVMQDIKDGIIKYIKAGDSNNAVAGKAVAVIDKSCKWIDKENSRLAHAIKIKRLDDGDIEITAIGRSTHAASPFEGIDSVAVLSQFLLEKNIGSEDEKNFLEFLSRIAGKPKGQDVGLNCGDEHFKFLTIAPTTLSYSDGKIQQTFDVRFPMCIGPEEIEETIKKHMPKKAKFKKIKAYPPFIINPKSKLIKALSDAYVDATGEETNLFTMGGATYARSFECATSYGPLRTWVAKPAWVGTLHGPDEGISVDEMKTSFNIYVYAIKNMMELDLEDENFVHDTMTLE